MPVSKPVVIDDQLVGISQLARGRSDGTGQFTIALSVATTAVVNEAIQVGDILLCTPITSAAGTEAGSGSFWITPATAPGTITVNHVNSATAARTFSYEVKESLTTYD